MARLVLSIFTALGVSILAGALVAQIALLPLPWAEGPRTPAMVLNDGETDQVLRLLSGPVDLNDPVILDQPLAEWSTGDRVTLFDILITQDNDSLLLLALALQPVIHPDTWAGGLCVAGRKGKGSLLGLILEGLTADPTNVQCQDGRLPSELAAENGHSGAAAFLQDAGY